ncbi:hypothetical protein PIB30_011674 [Stylosanthes scabra]|uniref:Uncharacterized protein n=1 Tax=Stylosanthes scabra TaxID=79078 RepID=A0ABU6X395_9FABA|nr:hypothetical protein [Stylosanthes scabra]
MLLQLLFFFLLLLPVLLFFLTHTLHQSATPSYLPKCYPLIGSYLAFKVNAHRRIQWLSDILLSSPTATFTLQLPLGRKTILTANPANVQHILNTHFHVYQKGPTHFDTLYDLLGAGIFNIDGHKWKFQRQIAIHEFTTKSLRNFVQHVVNAELSHRLLPLLCSAAEHKKILDFQDVLQRFAFDNICKIAFGFDAEYLTQSPNKRSNFAEAFEEASIISSKRFREPLHLIWKIKRMLNIGSEKRLRIAVCEVREFAMKLIREKKKMMMMEKTRETKSSDMLSRFLSSGHSEVEFVTDIVISFILAGKDTTSAALTWFFWLLAKNPRVEKEILREIMEKSESPDYDEVKEMVYTQAALCESMRLYPPVPMDTKEAASDDVLPDGSVVKKGVMVTYHVYAMGRMESIWGGDWAEFRPERWLERVEGLWRFVGKDCYRYPVFQGGPRVCLGKEMAILQMKRVVAGVLRRFRVVPVRDGMEPEFVAFLTAQMKGGFFVNIQQRPP